MLIAIAPYVKKAYLCHMKRYIAFSVFSFCAIIGMLAHRPAVVAHRGFHRAEGSAQNSIRALVKSDSIKADYCEFDVWISADGVLYVNHDPSIQGVVIEKAQSSEIDTCTLKNGERVPRLEAFLDTAATLSVGLVLEVKPHSGQDRENAAVSAILNMVEQKGLKDRTTYITFSENACRKLVELSDRPVYYLTGVPPEKIDELGATGPDFHISHFRKNPCWIETFHSRGMPVNIWTVDSDEDIKFCIAEGADFITTNEPLKAKRLVEEALEK